MHKKFYRLDSKGKVRLWEIKVEGNCIATWDGVLGGKLKSTFDVVIEGKNIGKSNETTPEEQALKDAERKITLKLRRGYEANIPSASAPTFDDAFFNNPPRNFIGPKPLSKMPDDVREQLGDRLAYTRKWNGMCCHIVIGADNEPRIFTSAMDEKTEVFPEQIEEIRGMNFPPKSWFMCEAVHLEYKDSGDVYDCPDRMKTVFGSLTEKAIEWQQENGPVEFQIFNVLFIDGEYIDWTWEDRYNYICNLVGSETIDNLIHKVIIETYDYDEAVEWMKTQPEYEGYVIWHLDHTTMPIKWGGAPSRKGGAWKLKNFKEADVLIVSWETGKGKLNNDVATLQYGAYDSDGNIVLLGRGGSGLDATLRAEIKQATLPIVAEVKYEEITKAGKFRLPVILRTRIDKTPVECTIESLK